MNLNLSYDRLKSLYAIKGYKFREENLGLNLGAIRSHESQSNKFDDIGFLAWIEEGIQYLLTYNVTTDPGKYYLMNPMNKDGTIITVPGQYIEVYGRGLHNGQYECFKQHRDIYYVRDNNRDSKLDFDLYRDPEKLKIHGFWGINGTNYHRASQWKLVQFVERYSAGCTVVQSYKIFQELINVRDRSVFAGYKLWDYTLFEEDDVELLNIWSRPEHKKSFDLLMNNRDNLEAVNPYFNPKDII